MRMSESYTKCDGGIKNSIEKLCGVCEKRKQQMMWYKTAMMPLP